MTFGQAWGDGYDWQPRCRTIRWDNCPKAWADHLQGIQKVYDTIRGIADYNTWFWIFCVIPQRPHHTEYVNLPAKIYGR